MASTSQSSLPLRISLTVLSIQIPVLQILSVPEKIFENTHYKTKNLSSSTIILSLNVV